jgi:endoglucanase
MLAPNASAQTDRLWVNPETQAARWVAQNAGDSRAALIDERIAQTPAGTWFTQTNPTGGIESRIAEVVSGAASANAAPVIVIYNIPNRDCGGPSGGGASSHAEYRNWIDRIASQLSGPAHIVLEPDVLPLNCYDAGERSQINQSIGYAAQTLKGASSQAKVYIDIGHAAWLTPSVAAQRLQEAGLQHADGFSINVSNYRTTQETASYANSIQEIVGTDKGAVIDTSRNGNGPLDPPNPNDWCDPPGRAIGDYPRTNPGLNGIDALLWVKLPGEADGCAAGAGQFVPDLAYELANAAGPGWPGDLPTDPTTSPTSDAPTTDDLPTDPTTPTAGPDDGCTASIAVANDWGSGWQGNVNVAAGSTAVNGWTLTWTWPSGQSVSSHWNANLTQSGSTVTASDVGWNGQIGANQSREVFGFIGNGSSASPVVTCTAR